MLNKDSKIYVAGHRGMIGTALMERLRETGFRNLVYRSHSELDLTRQADVEAFFEREKPEYVIMNAAMVANSVNVRIDPVGLMVNNTLMICNVLTAAAENHVKKTVFTGSCSCYPSDAETERLPDGTKMIREEAMRPGRIEVYAERYYALPKQLGMELSRTLTATGKMPCVTAVLTHIYGTAYYYDDPQRLSVYPALVKRFCDAVKNREEEVVVWGTGNLRREFTNARDVADAIILLLDCEETAGIYNVASGRMVSIRELAERLKAITGFQGKITYDTSKPEAAEYPMLCTDKLRGLGWKPQMDLESGIEQSCEYYKKY